MVCSRSVKELYMGLGSRTARVTAATISLFRHLQLIEGIPTMRLLQGRACGDRGSRMLIEKVMVGCKKWRPYLIMAIATFVCHGPLLFCDYLVWDDLWMIEWIQNGDMAYVYQHCSEVGHT